MRTHSPPCQSWTAQLQVFSLFLLLLLVPAGTAQANLALKYQVSWAPSASITYLDQEWLLQFNGAGLTYRVDELAPTAPLSELQISPGAQRIGRRTFRLFNNPTVQQQEDEVFRILDFDWEMLFPSDRTRVDPSLGAARLSGSAVAVDQSLELVSAELEDVLLTTIDGQQTTTVEVLPIPAANIPAPQPFNSFVWTFSLTDDIPAPITYTNVEFSRTTGPVHLERLETDFDSVPLEPLLSIPELTVSPGEIVPIVVEGADATDSLVVTYTAEWTRFIQTADGQAGLATIRSEFVVLTGLIPEPTSASLLGLSLAGLLLRRRRLSTASSR